MGSNTAVYGLYRNRSEVENAVDVLRRKGFRNTDISVLLPLNEGDRDFVHEKKTKAPEGAAAGAGSGAVVGGVIGWLSGAGLLALAAVGPLIAAGPIMGLLAGIGVGGTMGGLLGGLIGLGIPEYEAKRYEGRIKNGGILLSVHCDNSLYVDRAKELLDQTGAEDISASGEARANIKSELPAR